MNSRTHYVLVTTARHPLTGATVYTAQSVGGGREFASTAGAQEAVAAWTTWTLGYGQHQITAPTDGSTLWTVIEADMEG